MVFFGITSLVSSISSLAHPQRPHTPLHPAQVGIVCYQRGLYHVVLQISDYLLQTVRAESGTRVDLLEEILDQPFFSSTILKFDRMSDDLPNASLTPSAPEYDESIIEMIMS